MYIYIPTYSSGKKRFMFGEVFLQNTSKICHIFLIEENLPLFISLWENYFCFSWTRVFIRGEKELHNSTKMKNVRSSFVCLRYIKHAWNLKGFVWTFFQASTSFFLRSNILILVLGINYIGILYIYTYFVSIYKRLKYWEKYGQVSKLNMI